jgi:predicted metal-dependent hydrolase
MSETVMYGERFIRFDVVPNNALSTKIRIHVHPNARIEVETPAGTLPTDVRVAVLKRARWIENQLAEIEEVRRHVLVREYVSGESHFYLGRRYQLKVVESREISSVVCLKGGLLCVVLPRADAAAVRRRLNLWYRERANAYFSKRLGELLQKTPWVEAVPAVKLVTMRRQWGSCSPSGSINLNPHLIRAPRECVDYVLLHEICHIREHNHSKEFYALLEKVQPGWRRIKAHLDGMAELLLAA